MKGGDVFGELLAELVAEVEMLDVDFFEEGEFADEL